MKDTYNHKIKMLNPKESSICSISGTGMAGDSDGTIEAKFNEPTSLDVLVNSESKPLIFIADTNNHSVRFLLCKSHVFRLGFWTY